MKKVRHIFISLIHLRFIFLFCGLGLYLILCGQAYEPVKLDVQGDLNITSATNGSYRASLAIEPRNSSSLGGWLLEDGTLGYNVTDHKFYGVASGAWKLLGSGGAATDRYEVARIVAASNSIGTTCAGVDCMNSRADYTCNGTDDGAVINGAINYVANQGGGVVYLLEGAYNLFFGYLQFNWPPMYPRSFPDFGQMVSYYTSNIEARSNVSLIGSGRATVIRAANGQGLSLGQGMISNYIVTAPGHEGSPKNFLISQMTLDGNKNNGATSPYGVYLKNTFDCKIDKVWIENMSGDGIALNGFGSGTSRNVISRCDIRNNGGNGINLDINCSDNTVYANNIRGNAAAGVLISPFYSQNNNINSNNIQGNGAWGVKINLASRNHIFGNVIQDNLSDGVYVYTFNDAMVSILDTNFITANNIYHNSGYGVNLSGPWSGTAVSTNNIRDNTKDGIYVASMSRNNFITNNMIRDNGGTGANNGIKLESSCVKNHILGNYISDVNGSGYGIYMGSANNNYLFANQIIDSGGYAGRLIYNDLSLGANSVYTDKLALSIPPKDRVVNWNDTLDPVADNTSHYKLSGSGNLSSTTAIANGKSIGDILILEAAAGYSYNIPNRANTILSDMDSQFGIVVGGDGIYKSDILVLIWNGNDWLQLMYTSQYTSDTFPAS